MLYYWTIYQIGALICKYNVVTGTKGNQEHGS
jgi:hypothetical protein